MRYGLNRLIVVVALFAIAGSCDASPQPPTTTRSAPLHYDHDIRPILAENCFACHGFDGKRRQAGLRLDRADGALSRLVSGQTAIVPGRTAASELMHRVEASGLAHMPPASTGKRLSPKQIATLRRWIVQGARYEAHWSFVRPVRAPLPPVQDAPWCRNPIDRFVLARLEREGLRPSPEADRRTLIRRLTLDLTGLPPTLDEVNAFVADRSPDAYGHVVDRLLDSPHYGERMALAWLDLARYADTHGYHIDSQREMWPWRDWVIRAFNRDLPYDQFTVQQLAGDLLPNATLDQKVATGFNRNHPIDFEGGAIPEEYQVAYVVDRVDTTATTFMGLSLKCAECHDHKYDPIAQRDYFRFYAYFNTVPEQGLDGQKGNAVPFLKLPSTDQQTLQTDYTRQLNALNQRLDARIVAGSWMSRPWARAASANPASAESDKDRLTIPITSEEVTRIALERCDPDYRSVKVELAALTQKQADLEAAIPTTMVMAEMEKPRDTFMLVRGQYDQHGDRVTPGTPAFLPPPPAGAPANRLTLARWLVDPAHPLTARVEVNRIWAMLFGTGLVKTAEDFGTQGEEPSHPELLDWLAASFEDRSGRDGDPPTHRGTDMARAGQSRQRTCGSAPAASAYRLDWSVKRLLRLIVTSSTYRQLSRVSPALLEKDPENRLLARGPRFRLQAELIRDQALALAGLLSSRIGGPSVKPYHPAGLWEELAFGGGFSAQSYQQEHGEALYRRGMYTFWKRTCPPPMLQAFDAPEREFCVVRRGITNTPLQALALMNDPTFVEAARRFGERIMQQKPDPAARVDFGFRLATARSPKPAEARVLLDLYRAQLAAFRKDPAAAVKLLGVGESARDARIDPVELAAWSSVADVILNLDETITKS